MEILNESLFAEEVDHEVTSIDIAPANEKVICADFADPDFFESKKFQEKSFDQILFLYVLSYMPDSTTRLRSLCNASKGLKLGGQLLIGQGSYRKTVIIETHFTGVVVESITPYF